MDSPKQSSSSQSLPTGTGAGHKSPGRVQPLFQKDDCAGAAGGGDGSVSIISKSSSSPSSSTKSFDVDDELLTACDNLTVNQKFDYSYNVIMLGDSGVGKTDLIGRLCDDEFETKFFATIGLNMESYILEDTGCRFKLQIWDPSGSERFRYVVTKYFHNAHGIMFVYDVNYQKSFESIKEWIRSINQNPEVGAGVAKILIGNKCDVDRRAIGTSDGEALAAQHGMKFMETSSRTGANVRQAFTTLCQDIKANQEKYPVPSSSSSARLPSVPEI